jgi:predicted NAD-dependent protein-ADP-ribosyltransferase YbiA (DUF1768 family)
MTPDQRLAELRAAEAAGRPLDLLPFWGHRPTRSGEIGTGCLSQWWPVVFTLDGVSYPSAEHWMMAGKARLFGDEDGLAAVLGAASPGIWGVGKAATNPDVARPSAWRGLNLLGFALMEVRERL